MTEQEWLVCEDPRAMYAEMMNLTPSRSDRKWRLLACAIQSVRLVYVQWDDRERIKNTITDAIAWTETGKKPSCSGSGAYYVLMEPAHRGVGWLIGQPRSVSPEPVIRDKEMDRKAADLLREVIGDPFRPVKIRCSRLCDIHNPSWLTLTALSIAQQIYTIQDYTGMPILADAMEEAGCDVQSILEHLRSSSTHVRGCWALDLILGKE